MPWRLRPVLQALMAHAGRPRPLARSLCTGGDKKREALTPLAQAAFDAREELARRERAREGTASSTMVDAREDMSAFEILANARIRQAQAEGEFDNLAGKGKPLPDLGFDHHSEHGLANKILKNSGVVPDWIRERKALLDEVKAARGKLSSMTVREAAALASDTNAKIARYNLKVPVGLSSKHVAPLRVS